MYLKLLERVARWLAPTPTGWQQVIVGRRGRGPRADMLYRGIEVNGVRYLFTVEAVEHAEARAQKHWY
jgi:hypothetical protein